MLDLLKDVSVAVRSLGRSPGFVVVALLSLGLGIGAVTTVYTWTDRFLVNPLPGVEASSRLVNVLTRAPGSETWSISYPNFQEWRDRNRVFEGVVVSSTEQVGVRFGEGVDRAWANFTTDNQFELLGVRALHGRTFQAGEEARAAPVVVLGYSYWERRFDADPGVVGRTLVINGHNFEVVGVLPPRFGGAYVGFSLDLYVPITMYPVLFGQNSLTERGNMFLQGVARLKPGVTYAQAEDDMTRIGRELEQLFPDVASTPVLVRIDEQGPPATMKPVLFALLGVTALVLLIACANVANLLLVRAAGRQKELAVRLAVGAGRGRLVRQLLTESAMLAAGGGALGLLMAYWGRNVLVAAVPPTPFPLAIDFEVNPGVVLLALALSSATVLLFGLWPAVRASRPDLVPVLKDLPTGGRSRSGSRSTLVGAQVALAVVSLATAGLFLRAMQQVRAIDPGFRDPDRLLLVGTDFQVAGVPDSASGELLDRVLERIRAVPGVAQASAATFVPLGWGCCSSSTAVVDGYTPARDENMSVVYSRVAADYFETMGIPLVKGRGFTQADRGEGPDVAVVNEAFVQRYWPGQEPLGRQFRQRGRTWTVIGVAKDGHYRQLTDQPFPLVYHLYAKVSASGTTIHVRAAGDAKALIETLRKEVRAVDGDLPFLDPRTMSESMLQSTIGQQLGSRALAAFGLLALFLAAVGLYGVMAYTVSQRTREIGVRVALGAAVGDVTRLVTREGLRITAIGGIIGGVLALGAGRLVRGLLLGVNPADPATFGVIALIMAAVALVASLIPARRAARVNVVDALRAE